MFPLQKYTQNVTIYIMHIVTATSDTAVTELVMLRDKLTRINTYSGGGFLKKLN